MRQLEPGAASRKVRKQLPPLERKIYRRPVDTFTRAALRDDEAARTLAEDLHATKRAHFTYLRPRRRVSSLGEVVHCSPVGDPSVSRLDIDAGNRRSSDAVTSGD
ncbi:MAG: hypothetical protein AVDCRST_MAG93-1517 [uncultured Chloroflexia bacterium]|uniref:Uncharacterized protein n=1 Tax=uncultured Chloroflexia bacterium TaxID=1672391 RepID=A0A6J4IBR5_9CHLR|nr:MAG: hypothetical protein AVDCRST_MAG93-1517 [uncultured Chloroflexia bacterium]